MSKIQGTNLIMGHITESGMQAFAYARSCDINQTADKIETCSPTSARAKEYLPGRTSWIMSCECLLAKDESVIEEMFRTGETFPVRCRNRDNSGYEYRGMAFISSLRASGRLHEMATYSITLQGTGELEYQPVAI